MRNRIQTRSLARLQSEDAKLDDGKRHTAYSTGYANGVMAAYSYLRSLQRNDTPLRFAIQHFHEWARECKDWSKDTRRTKRLEPPEHP